MTLAEYLTANLQKPFAWGSHDCVLFAAAWVKHATGIDYLEAVPRWKSAKEAARILKDMGGIHKVVNDRLKQIHPHFASDGDLAIYQGRIAIFSGMYIVGPGPNGLVNFDRMVAECAWSL